MANFTQEDCIFNDWKLIKRSDGYFLITTKRIELIKWFIQGTIPFGFISNGFSVPKFFRRKINNKIKSELASPIIVLDWMSSLNILPKKERLEWFRNTLIANGFSKYKAWILYFLMRIHF